MIEIEYSYASVPTIKRFSRSEKRSRGLMGPFGSGKSSGCVIELVKWGKRQVLQADGKRRARFAVIRNTYQQLADTTIKTFLRWLPDRVFGTYRERDHSYHLNALDDLDVEFIFRALDRPEQVANLLSLELTGAWVNEAREVPYAIVQVLDGRINRYPSRDVGGAVNPGIIFDTNPPEDDSWWYRFFEEKLIDGNPVDDAEVFKQPSGRAPDAENLPGLPPRYYETLMNGKSADYIRVYVDGQYGYVKDGKPVYPEFNEGIHLADIEPLPGLPIKRGWDFGLTPACIFSQVLPDGRWIIFDEMCATDVGISSFADAVNRHSAERYPNVKFEDFGDPAGAQRSAMTADKDEKTCFDILKGKGIQIEPAEQNVTIRLESVRKPLCTLIQGKPQFQLHSRCIKLRKGFGGRYQYRRVKISGSAERYHDEPDKNEYSHPHDALQYIGTRVFGNSVRNKPNTLKLPPLVYPKNM